jgi:Flp pilus assembly pilin Flp
MMKTANREFMTTDERIQGQMMTEYAFIPAAVAVVVYDVCAATGNNIGSISSRADSSPIQICREQQSRVLGIQKNSEEERE